MPGDHRGWAVYPVSDRGPPPRARGPRDREDHEQPLGGTTPACAGTTERGRAGTAGVGDHPRVRGDHKSPPSVVTQPQGPPPRARGPLDLDEVDGLITGTTPACAGTTRPGTAVRRGGRDHPRVRGDHLPGRVPFPFRQGPPPRARGPRSRGLRGNLSDGTTPACAGTTHRAGRGRRASRDHPRVRGDHNRIGPRPASCPGPPPRARGPRLRPRPGDRRPGTTPACAGTTRRRSC